MTGWLITTISKKRDEQITSCMDTPLQCMDGSSETILLALAILAWLLALARHVALLCKHVNVWLQKTKG